MTATYTRQQLYDLAWSTPIATLARDLGVSGVGLAKLCRRHRIPCPPRGYWAKLRHGKVIRQPALPGTADEGLIQITPTPIATPAPAEPPSAPTAPAIVVEAELRNPHPLVRATQAALQPGRSGRKVDWSNVLDLSCSESSLDRALRIWDALIKAVEARGGRVTVERHHGRRVTTAALGADPVPLRVWEKHDQMPNPEYAGPLDWHHPKVLSTPSGRLELRIGEDHGVLGERSRADGKRLKLEDRLSAILDTIAEYSVAVRDRRLRWEEAARQNQREEQERADRARRAAELDAELSGLLKLVDAWRKSRDIRSLIRAVARRAAEMGLPLEPGSHTGEWIALATSHADRIDPLMAASAREEAAR